jgi:hypothetical protein
MRSPQLTAMHEDGRLITPERSARSLLTPTNGDATGQIWTVEDAAS